MLVNRSMPAAAVIPVLGYEDVAEAADWLCDTFGFAERWRAGSHRAQLAIGDAAVAITGRLGSRGSNVMIRVERRGRALRAGARARRPGLGPPADYPYGERQYTAVDLGGHTWTFSQSIADVPPEDWGGASGPAIQGTAF